MKFILKVLARHDHVNVFFMQRCPKCKAVMLSYYNREVEAVVRPTKARKCMHRITTYQKNEGIAHLTLKPFQF